MKSISQPALSGGFFTSSVASSAPLSLSLFPSGKTNSYWKKKKVYIHTYMCVYIYMSWSEMTETDRFEWLWSIQSSFLGLMLA